MSELKNISVKDILFVLNKLDFHIIRQKGSHIILKNQEGDLIVVPNHKVLKIGTVLQIIKASRLTKEKFLDYLK